jgi:hypothetical protein
MIYIWINQELLNHHVGVKRTLFNLKILAHVNDIPCEFLLLESEKLNKGLVHKLHLHPDYIMNNGFKKNDNKFKNGESLLKSLISLDNVYGATNVIGAPWLANSFFSAEVSTQFKPIIFLPDLIPIKYAVNSLIPYGEFSDAHVRAIDFCHQDKARLMVCSSDVLDELLELRPQKINRRNVTVIHPGVYVQHLLNFETSQKHNGRFNLLVVNILDERKGLDQATEMLGNFSEPAGLTLIGAQRCSKSKFLSFKKSIKKYKLNWIENATSEELVAELVSADLLLFPSIDEGYGIPALEANFFGLTVLSYKRLPVWRDLYFKIEIDALDKDPIYSAAQKISPVSTRELSDFRMDLLQDLPKWFDSLLAKH